MQPDALVALYVLGALVLLAFVKLLCHLTLAENFQSQQDETKEPVSVLLKCLVLYLQWMLLVASLNIDWPASIAYPFQFLAWLWAPSNPETLSIDCLLSGKSGVPIAVQRVLFYVSAPVVLLALLLVLELLWSRLRHKRSNTKATMADRLGSSSMVVVFFFLPGMLRVVFGMFACAPLDTPVAPPHTASAVGSFWVHDVSTVCFAGWHRSLSLGLGMPLILLLCIGMPAAIVYITVSNRASLDDRVYQQHWGFLTRAYSARRCWWEAVVVCQSMALVAVSVFGSNMGALVQTIVMTAVLGMFLFLLRSFEPFAYQRTARSMLQGVQCLLLTTFIGHTFQLTANSRSQLQTRAGGNHAATYGMVMGVLLLLVNLAYVCSVLWQLVRLVEWQPVQDALIKWCASLKVWVTRHLHKHTRRTATTPQCVQST
jgi:hypothetical protein